MGLANTPWAIHLFPYLDQANAYRQFNFQAVASSSNYGWIVYDPSNLGVGSPTNVIVPGMVCPSDGLGGKWHHSPFAHGDDLSSGQLRGLLRQPGHRRDAETQVAGKSGRGL